MTRYTTTAEPGTDQAAVASQDVPGVKVSKSGGSTLAYSTTQKMHGTKGLRLAAAAGSNAFLWVDGFTSAAGAAIRGYVYLTAYPSTTMHLAQIRTAASGIVAILAVTSTGRVQVQNAASQVPTSPVTGQSAVSEVIPLNTWVRVELTAVPGTTTGNGRLRGLFAVGDGAATWSFDSATQNTGTVAVGDLRFGRPNTTGEFDGWLDDVTFDDASADLIGAATAQSPPVVDAGPDQTRETSSGGFTLTATAAGVGGATVVARQWEQLSGPAASFAPANAATTTVTAPAGSGVAVFRHTVTDSNGLTAPDTVSVTFVVPGQSLRPNGVVALGGWTATPAATPASLNLDETTADDSDYVRSPNAPAAGTAKFVVSLQSGSNPGGTANRVVQYRARRSDAATTHALKVSLLQGTTVVATRTVSDLSTSFETREFTLTSGEAGAITDWAALRLEFDPAAT